MTTTDELMALVTAFSDAREDYKRWLSDSPSSAAAYGAARATLRTALEAVAADAQRLDFLQENPGCNLISDDGERWALSSCGFQPVPEDDGFKTAVTINSVVTPDEWKLGVRAAIDAAIDTMRAAA